MSPAEQTDDASEVQADATAAPAVPTLGHRLAGALADPADLMSAVIWLASRISVYLAGWFASWALATGPDVLQGEGVASGPSGSFADAWNRWDALHFASIVEYGYGAAGFETNYAFFPGFPLAMRAVMVTGASVTVAGLIVSFLAGLAAAVALGRLAKDVGARPELGVLAWVLAPMAVYLAAPYSEALFCAFAFWAWVQVRKGAWVSAAILAMLASMVRVNGLFLAAAVAVAFLTSPRRQWAKAPAIILPFAGVLAIFAYYQSRTGTWMTWFEAQAAGWNRHLTNPWEAVNTMWDWSWNYGVAAPWAVQYRFEIAYVVILIAFSVVLLAKRWWGEAVFVVLTAVSLGTSTVFQSVPRSTLVLFPIWMLIGLWMTRSRVVRVLYVSIAAPLMLVSVALFVNAYWIS